ncbi:MAG TPA: hypothetical protein DCL73_06190, partial [Treponema sp.]|nr:hypothetical protein [Treponema sp.]
DESLKYEVIIIDSGNDNSESVVANFQKLKPDLFLYRKIKRCKNRSLLRNRGAAKAQYDILLFLDNDILVPPDYIQTHYEKHLRNDNLVLLGRRKSLTQFSLEDVGTDLLCRHFEMLDRLPWYDDERMYQNIGLEPWRFVYTHSLSMPAELFFKAGELDKKFGEQWGYEDIELGFRLQYMGCNFEFLKEICTYHQPHFNQSNKEQHTTEPNQKLLILLHNYYTIELLLRFYASSKASLFDRLFPELQKLCHLQEYLPSKMIVNKYDLVLGCLFEPNGNSQIKNHKKMQLGCSIPFEDKSKGKILLVRTFYELPEEVHRKCNCPLQVDSCSFDCSTCFHNFLYVSVRTRSVSLL